MNEIIAKQKRLRAALHGRLRGQDEVLDLLVKRVKRREYEVVPQRGSRGAYLFVGPTGVGKTETVLILAEILFGGILCRFDCSEFQSLTCLETLLGNRAGDRGRFGEAHAAGARGVWLFDEIEKAHPHFLRLFLQMTDAARISLASGEVLDLSGIYIIVTSNIGTAEIIGRRHLNYTTLRDHVVRCLERQLSPELLGRFGKPFVYRPLTDEDICRNIVVDRLTRLLAWEAERGRVITYAPELVDFLVQRGFSNRYGARPLLDFIEEAVGDAVVENLDGGGTGNGQLVVDGDQLLMIP